MEIVANNIDELYQRAIAEVLLNGILVTARGLDFMEVRFQHLILTNPRARWVSNKSRKLSKKFVAAEFIWMMSGKCNLEQMTFYNKKMADFSDDGISLHGAYGPRLRHWNVQHGDVDQLENCLNRLKNDLFTRQASIVILDPSIDFTEKTKDVPCNNYLQFLCREGKLDLMCYVRSNDLMLGLPYDIWHWTMLQEMFASILGVEVGEYHHIIGSMHVYNKDEEAIRNILNQEIHTEPMLKMPKINDLNIIKDLETMEYNYRVNNVFDDSGLNDYWKAIVKPLKSLVIHTTNNEQSKNE